MNDSSNTSFESKWGNILKNPSYPDEKTLFVPRGQAPRTQRQFNLYHYFEFIGKKIEGKPYKTVLEVGCGRGTIALYLHTYRGMEMSLVDSSEDAINLAKYNFDLWDGKGEFFVEDARKLSFPDESFDVVVSIGLLEHLEDYTPVLRECFRTLKKGGALFFVNIPQKKSIQVLNNFYRGMLRLKKTRLQKDYFRNADRPEDYVRNTKEAGFSDVKYFYVNPFPLFTPLSAGAEKALTAFYRGVYILRGMFMRYPFRGSRYLSQAHFLTAKKK